MTNRRLRTLSAFFVFVCMTSWNLSALAGDEKAPVSKRQKEVEALQKKFNWWPTDAKPGAVKDAERGGYWWMPTEPGKMRPWGNRGYIYVYKIIFDYKEDRLPSPKPNELRPSLLIRTIERNIKIYFDYDKALLREDAVQILKSALKALKKNPDNSILITGNADVRGSEQYNMKLAEARAESIRGFMLKNGVDEGRIRIVSRGKLDAIAHVTDLEGMQRDRNAQFMIADVQEVMLPYQGLAVPEGVKRIDDTKFTAEAKEVIESDIKVSTREYVVKEGDTLSRIAENELGSAYRWEYLFEINKGHIKHPDRLKAGERIIIPVE